MVESGSAFISQIVLLEAEDYLPEDVRVASVRSGKLEANSTLLSQLSTLNIPPQTVDRVIDKFSELFDLNQSQPGDAYSVYLDSGDSVLGLEYTTVDSRVYRLKYIGGDFIGQSLIGGNSKRIEFAGAVVETDLWDALVQLLPDPDMFARIAQIYASQIDLFSETNAGDTFRVVYEAYYLGGEFLRCGDILAVEYVLAGVSHRAFFYSDPSGYSDYYDDNGYSLRRAMLKSPLDYRSITSRFSFRRLHPRLKIYRPHLGVDYAAAPGTPVVSAGDGAVVYRGRVNGFGNYLEIEHDFGLTTCYGHLRGFASGTMPGQRVVQGQVIGYVGSTGESTGPHLDYRVKRDGRYINPLKMTLPAMPPVRPDFLQEFKSIVEQRLEILERPIDTQVYVYN